MCIPSYNVNTPGWVDGSDANGNAVPTYYSEVGHIVDPNTGLDVVPGCQRLERTPGARVRAHASPAVRRDPGLLADRPPAAVHALGDQPDAVAERDREGARARPPVLASLHRDKGLLPGDLVYLVGQLRGISTGAVEFRAVPGDATAMDRHDSRSCGWIRRRKEIFAAIREGKPITGVGTQLVNTPPSEANTTVAVIDADSGGKAAGVEDLLVQRGLRRRRRGSGTRRRRRPGCTGRRSCSGRGRTPTHTWSPRTSPG